MLAAVVGGCVAPGPPKAVAEPPGVDIHRNLTFATVDAHPLQLDLYVPHGTKGRLPVVMWIYGGGWFRGSRQPCPVALLATRGYAVAAVEYRHSGEAPFPAQIQDVKAAVRWIRQHPDQCHADPNRIGVWGSSAGGTLACLLGLTAGEPALEGSAVEPPVDTAVQCVVAFFPATDMGRLFTDEFPVSWRMRYAVRHLLGGANPKTKPELAQQASPIHWVRPGVAPHLVIHGGNDPLIPPQHCVDFTEQLLRSGVEAHAYVVGGFTHGNNILYNQQVWEQVLGFLDRHLKVETTAMNP